MTVAAWHQLCTLREDVRTGQLTLAEFAADLNDVRTGQAPAVYREPALFFDRTYPTFRIKELARDVLLRLAGRGGRPVLRLQVAYGGGKTHTLIALLHLAERGPALADHPTVAEFLAFAGLSQLPRARVALLPGDKFDVKEGLEVYSPQGQTRRAHTLWGALAYQLAGDAGYARLKAHDEDFTVPAEPLLVDLLKVATQDGSGALVLVDEAVWYYRGLVNANPRMLGTIKDFYQVLNQAVAKVERAAMVASLIASRVEANDQTGTQCLAALEEVFQRIAEPVDPVSREDVAEILRRRLFERVAGDAERRPAVDALMAAMQRLPLPETQRDQAAYARLMDSYPFHPDLISVLYQKWTQLARFQRTRGALRLLACALRDSDGHDPSPVIGPAAFLPAPARNALVGGEASRGASGLSATLNELLQICEEGERWTSILTGELEKARLVQAGLPSLKARQIEQAVIATFLHSQPLGQRAAPHEILSLLVDPECDVAALEDGLRKWRNASWFLVEDPDVWQLGTTANLTRIHTQAMEWLTEAEIDDELRQRIRAIPALRAADPGVEVHILPESPRAVSDDLKLHYLVLAPQCALQPGKPLPRTVEAYLNERTGPNDPRIYRNNLIALAPEVSRVAGLREQVRRWLAWGRLERSDLFKLLTEPQKKLLPKRKQETANGLPEAVVAAYNIMVAADEDGSVQAQVLRGDGAAGGTPFERIKATLADGERLVTTTLDPDLVLPGSYLSLWAEGQASCRVTDLMAAFGQFPRLPRLLRPESLYDTLRRGVREGILVLRLPRADGSARSWWRSLPDDDTLRRPEMEIQPASLAALHNLDPDLLGPHGLANWWPAPDGPVHLTALRGLFDGVTAPRLANPEVLDTALRTAVERGLVMVALSGNYLFREALPAGTLPDSLDLLPAPAPVRGADLTPQALPAAWEGGRATLQAIADQLAAQRDGALPWVLLQEAVNEALRLQLFETAPGSGAWPCSPATVDQVHLQLIDRIQLSPDTILAALEYVQGGAPTLHAIKESIETQLLGRSVPLDMFVAAVKSAIDLGTVVEADEWRRLATAGDPLTVRVRLPTEALLAETTLDAAALQRLADRLEDLLNIAPELAFTFRVALSAEGRRPDVETLRRLNEVLDEIQAGWKLS